jgi:hypothetical protein
MSNIKDTFKALEMYAYIIIIITFFGSTGGKTEVIMLAIQVFCHLSRSSSVPYCPFKSQ